MSTREIKVEIIESGDGKVFTATEIIEPYPDLPDDPQQEALATEYMPTVAQIVFVLALVYFTVLAAASKEASPLLASAVASLQEGLAIDAHLIAYSILLLSSLTIFFAFIWRWTLPEAAPQAIEGDLRTVLRRPLRAVYPESALLLATAIPWSVSVVQQPLLAVEVTVYLLALRALLGSKERLVLPITLGLILISAIVMASIRRLDGATPATTIGFFATSFPMLFFLAMMAGTLGLARAKTGWPAKDWQPLVVATGVGLVLMAIFSLGGQPWAVFAAAPFLAWSAGMLLSTWPAFVRLVVLGFFMISALVALR